MSGHNKWSKIKHKKATSDAQKSKHFSKLSRLITVEVKRAEGDRNSASVRKVVEQAKAINMPNENIEKAIKRAEQSDTQEMESVVYEAYGPEGVAMVIEGLTDNRNRTAAEIKSILSKHSMELAQPGSALWAFERTEEGYKTTTPTSLTNEAKEKLSVILDNLENNDDVQATYNNAE